MIVAIDFDGTIVENQFPDIGKMLPDAVESINYLYGKGHKIIIWTSRDGNQLLDAINFIMKNQISFHRINDNLPENTEKYGSNSRKVYAHRYVDDHNIGGFPGWKACIADIEAAEADYLKKRSTNQPVLLEIQPFENSSASKCDFCNQEKEELFPIFYGTKHHLACENCYKSILLLQKTHRNSF